MIKATTLLKPFGELPEYLEMDQSQEHSLGDL